MAKKKSPGKEATYCKECKNAYLMQSRSSNPIVAECRITHERQAANTPLSCELFEKSNIILTINPMIEL